MSEADEEADPIAELRARRERVRSEMGGAHRIERLHARGERTVREHIGALLDPGSFEEVGVPRAAALGRRAALARL